MSLTTPALDPTKVRRTLLVSIKLDQRETGAYSDSTIAEGKIVAPFPLDVEQTHQAIADTLALLIRNTDRTHGVIPSEAQLGRARIDVDATVDDPLAPTPQLEGRDLV